jgi:glycine cleavage system aminomethyltransferase T
VTLEFLAADLTQGGDARPVARSAIEPCLRAAGARFELRDGWSVATSFGSVEAELATCRTRVGVGDRSALGKLEVQGSPDAVREVIREVAEGAELELGTAARAAGAFWCPVTARRALALTGAAGIGTLRERLERAAARAGAATVAEVTTTLGALAVVGPRARELFARLTALDLRPTRMPERGFRPGSVARTPAMVLRERGDRFVLLFGAAYGEYVWTVVTDAAQTLGGAPVGADALERLAEADDRDGGPGRGDLQDVSARA